MRLSPELMQFEIGISTRRYLPASGTAGLDRSRVSGKSRVPCPPPMMMERTLLILTEVSFAAGIQPWLLNTAPRPVPPPDPCRAPERLFRNECLVYMQRAGLSARSKRCQVAICDCT